MVESQVVCRIRDRIEEIYSRGSVLGDDGRFHAFGSEGMPRLVGAFLAGLVRSERPRATLETGMAWGRSILFIVQALLENGDDFRPHVAIDPFQSAVYQNAARRALRELGIDDLVEFYEERSEFVLPRLIQQKRRFDMVFIDADHRFAGVFVELQFLHALLRPGGLMIFDDSDWDAVHLTCRFAQTNLGYRPLAELGPRLTQRGESRRVGPLYRPRICAYRKPLAELDIPHNLFVPFFEDFVPLGLSTERIPLESTSPQLLRQAHLALRAGQFVFARACLKAALRLGGGGPSTYLRLLRTYLPRRLAAMLSKPSRTHRRTDVGPSGSQRD